MTSWTTPRTWTNNDPTASQFNTDLRDNTNYLQERLSGYIDAVSTDVTFSTSAAENTLYSYSVAGGEMTSTGLIKFDYWIYLSNNKGSSGTYTLKFYIGSNSQTIVSAATVNDAATITRRGYVWIRGDGTTSSQRMIYGFDTFANGSSSAGMTAAEATMATDISTSQTWKLTCTLSASSASFLVTCRFAGLTYNIMTL